MLHHALRKLAADWPQVAPRGTAPHSRVIGVQNAALIIGVDTNEWSHHLAFCADAILYAVNRRPGMEGHSLAGPQRRLAAL